MSSKWKNAALAAYKARLWNVAAPDVAKCLAPVTDAHFAKLMARFKFTPDHSLPISVRADLELFAGIEEAVSSDAPDAPMTPALSVRIQRVLKAWCDGMSAAPMTQHVVNASDRDVLFRPFAELAMHPSERPDPYDLSRYEGLFD